MDSLNIEPLPKSIDEVIKLLGSDTVVFYYNERWQLVRPECATIFRISNFDQVLGTFAGKFTDYYYCDSTKAVEGIYLNGKKEGKFCIYFPNGQLSQTGNYSNDEKNGIWEYYYPNGNKRQILDFQNKEIFIKEFWNEKGKKLVDSGDGKWFGFQTSDNFLRTSGNVLNGKKNGIWKNIIVSGKMTTNIEKYIDGRFIRGKMLIILGETEYYKDTIYCSIEKPLTFLTAEQFQINRCYKMGKNNWEYAEYPGGMKQFYREIREKIVLNEPITNGVIEVQTTIDKDGKMTNFKSISNTGHEFDLIKVLQTMSNWTPTKINGTPTIQPKIISFKIW
jgi:antitoxin component YwqK of YwqJK toxin-antitoxin module